MPYLNSQSKDSAEQKLIHANNLVRRDYLRIIKSTSIGGVVEVMFDNIERKAPDIAALILAKPIVDQIFRYDLFKSDSANIIIQLRS